MAKYNLEKFIKTKIENYGSPGDNERLWLNIQADLKKKKKRRFFWIIFFGTLILGVVGILGINTWTKNTDMTTVPAAQLKEMNEEPIASNQEKSMPSKELENLNDITNNALLGKKEQQENALKANDYLELNKMEVKGDDIIRLAKHQNEKNNQYENSKMDHENPMTKKSELNPSRNQLPNNPNKMVQLTSLLAIHHKYLVFNREPLFINQNIIPVIAKKRGNENNEGLKKITLGLHFKYGGIRKKLESKLSRMDAYIAERNNLETPMDVFGASIDLQMKLSDKFYVQTGLNFYQIYDRFEQTLIDDLLITVDNQLLIINYHPDGSSTNTFGEGEAINRTTITQNFYNKFRSIDVPLSLGYRVVSKKLYWNVDLGLSLNIWSLGDGQTINTVKENLNLNSKIHYKRQTGLNGIAATALGYHFTDNLSLEFRPEIRYQFSSSSTEESGYYHKYDSANFGIGLRFKI